MKVILASKSQRRIDIFNKLGFDFIVAPADINEDIEYRYPLFLPAKLAELKTESVASQYKDILTVGADTLVFMDKHVLGKPGDLREASEFLKKLSGRWHSVISGVCLIKFSENKKIVFSEESRVKFKRLDDNIINEYFSKVNPLDKAGAYAIQEHGNLIVEKVEGSTENIIGFPTEKFLKILKIF